MRRISVLVATAVLAGCAKKPEAPAAPPAAPAPAPINMASVAGMWSMKTMAAVGDSVLTTSTLTATADTSGWILTLPNRKPMTLHVVISGDSIMADAPSYESVLRKGVTVQTSSVYHLVGDKLMGTTKAHYSVTGPDSLVMLRTEGVKMPM